MDRTDPSDQVGGQDGVGGGLYCLLMAESQVLNEAIIPGNDQCANSRIGAYCTGCPEGQNVTADGCE